MNYLLISHGKLAEGILSACKIILGEKKNLFAINMYEDDENLESKLKHLFAKNDISSNKLIIITDIFGGSVNQKVIKLFGLKENIILTGMNLPMLLELLTNDSAKLDIENIRDIVNRTQKQIMVVNDFMEKMDEDVF